MLFFVAGLLLGVGSTLALGWFLHKRDDARAERERNAWRMMARISEIEKERRLRGHMQ